ncbi:MAG: PaaI family thioesterase [Gammaproteobacteria bacterium]
MTNERGRVDANNCFVCGPANPVGLQVEYRMDGDVCRASFTPGSDYVGFEDQVHGGIVYSALDDVMANWLFLQGARGHTAKCEIRYRKPVALGTRLNLEGRLVKRKGALAIMTASATRDSDGVTVADAQGSFMIVDQSESL